MRGAALLTPCCHRNLWIGLIILWTWAGLSLLRAESTSSSLGDELAPLPKLKDPKKPEIDAVAMAFARVAAWDVDFVAEQSGSSSTPGDYVIVDEAMTDLSSRGNLRLTRMKGLSWNPRRGFFKWQGEGKVQASVHAVSSHRKITGESIHQELSGAGSTSFRLVRLEIDLSGRDSSLHFGDQTAPLVVRDRARGMTWEGTGRPLSPYEWDRSIETGSLVPDIYYEPDGDRSLRYHDWFPLLANGPRAVTISNSLPTTHTLDARERGTPVIHRTTVMLSPIYDDLEVELKMDGYEKWRPEGSIEKPSSVGNSLVVTATLISKDPTQQANLPPVRHFTFLLSEVSREPGVCMNWPLEATDNDPDLRLALASMAGELSKQDSELKISEPLKDTSGRWYATARIDAYDFGANATLAVKCALEDGRELTGLLRSPAGDRRLVRLPMQEDTRRIADVWSRSQGTAGLSAADDSDNDPVGDGNRGDGFTLYEEYRGFVEDGRRIEGDPKRKDFFVLNLVGADASPGIDLFADISGLKVHSRLRPSEMSDTVRVMNGNHRDMPHRVDQHGVWVKPFGPDRSGGWKEMAIQRSTNYASRPKYSAGIFTVARDDPFSRFNYPVVSEGGGRRAEYLNYPLPASVQDAPFAYERELARMLMLTVGVNAHGFGNYVLPVSVLLASDPRNSAGRARFVQTAAFRRGEEGFYTGPSYTLVEEDTGRDLAAELEPLLEQLVEHYLSMKGKTPPAAGGQQATEWWAIHDHYNAASLDLRLRIGVDGGQDSGDDTCVMRSTSSRVYRLRADANRLILIPPGTSPMGLDFCTTPVGGGVNGWGRSPQSRHGDAAPGFGRCASQLCPNDAIPPRQP
jgi:hypothetical protein